MTFRSLYRLEARGLLDCPIVGVAVDDWTVDDLRDHARESIEADGEKVDPEVFKRFADRLSYVSGDFTDAATYAEVAKAMGDAKTPVFYLEIPPSLFGMVIEQLAKADLTKSARVVVEKPFGHDLESARALNDEIHAYIDESQLYRIDHFLGKMGLMEALYLRFANTMFEPVWNRNYVSLGPDHDGRGLRRRGPGALLRPGRSAPRRGRQPPHADARRSGDGAAHRRRPDDPQGLDRVGLPRDAATPTRRSTCAGSTRATATSTVSRKDSKTETFAALRLEIENWRWSGVPVLHPRRQGAAGAARPSCASSSTTRRDSASSPGAPAVRSRTRS